MRIMSLNMWQGRLERVLLKHLETLTLDFACTQEAVDCAGETAGLATSYLKIGTSLGLDKQYFSPLMGTLFGPHDLSFGNAVYSRLPFSATETIFTRGAYDPAFNFDSGDYNIRAFQHVTVTTETKELHLINHHGHHIDGHKLGDAETLRQVKQIADFAKTLHGAVIICGDFNLSPTSESIGLLGDGLRNLSIEYALPTTRSALTPKQEVCDYIFVNDQVRVNDFSMDETIVSDHNALILDFDL